MKNSRIAIAVFASLVATGAVADDDMNKQQKDSTMEQRTQDHDSAHGYQNPTGTDPNPRMTEEVQEDWREDAKDRREADVHKPEQH